MTRQRTAGSEGATQPPQVAAQLTRDAYWIPSSSIDEARLVRVLAEMARYFLATNAVKEPGDADSKNDQEMTFDEEELEPEEELQLAA